MIPVLRCIRRERIVRECVHIERMCGVGEVEEIVYTCFSHEWMSNRFSDVDRTCITPGGVLFQW
jgi:hypothetical protein